VGFKAGFNVAQPRASAYDADVAVEASLGGGAGLLVSGAATKKVSLDFELLFVRKGIDLERHRFGEYTLDYTVFGLNVRYALRPTGPTPYILVGSELGHMVSGEKEILEMCAPDWPTMVTHDAAQDLRGWDFGLAVGVGFEARGTPATYFLEFRRVFGLPDIAEAGGMTILTGGTYLFVGALFGQAREA
jgi:hypothetical protein